MRSVGKTEIGTVRTNNEDSIFLCNSSYGSLPNIYIVADGMGGHNAGEIASASSIQYFCDYVSKQQCQEEDLLDFLVSAVHYANNKIYELSKENVAYSGMGTTFSACVVVEDKVFIAHVGDSRVYKKSKIKLSLLTTDHTYVSEMMKRGELTPEQAKMHPNKNVITRALGAEETIQVDGIIQRITQGEMLLLCSDGLTNMLSEEELIEIITESDSLDMCVENLVDRANKNGGEDNISVILIEKER